MFRPLIIPCCVLLAIGSAAVVTGEPAAAAAQCRFAPAPPKRLAIGRNAVRLRVGIRVHGVRGCAGKMIVSTHLVHRKDDHYLSWLNTKPDVAKVYAGAFVPGRYRSQRSSCTAYDANSHRLSCTVSRTSIVIKYSGRAQFGVTRHGSILRFRVRARQFMAYQGYRPVLDHVAVQRRAGHRWVTIHRGIAPTRTGLTWRYRHSARATYRAISAGTRRTFAAVSDPVSK
jgi:hypothetical protein